MFHFANERLLLHEVGNTTKDRKYKGGMSLERDEFLVRMRHLFPAPRLERWRLSLVSRGEEKLESMTSSVPAVRQLEKIFGPVVVLHAKSEDSDGEH